MSAIEWLSRSIEPAAIAEPPVADRITIPEVTVTPLDRPSKDRIGLLPSHVTGLPPTIWSNSDEDTLVALVRAERVETLPALQDFLRVMMLAEADPPRGAGPEGALFLARIDKLLDLGALEPAKSLIEEANPDTPALFRRWFDVALLNGTEDQACNALRSAPSVAPTASARIFCLARNGDWNAAALTLNTNRVLGDISPAEEALLSRFLDTELYEGEPPLPRPERVSPLVFRMHEAIGEPLITANLPLAFAHADLRTTTAWKSQLGAVERLARHGAVSENVMQDVYTARTPAASGGVWDRAEAMQKFDTALKSNEIDQIASTLPAAWEAVKSAQAEVLFAKLYAADLQELPLQGQTDDIAFEIGLLSQNYELVARSGAKTGKDPFMIALARGAPQEVRTTDPLRIGIQAAFNGAPPPQVLLNLVAQGKLGEALLRGMAIFHEGLAGDVRSVTDALALFRSVGLEDLARRTALQLLILERSA
ncbi:hypothetical protein [Yoonia sediminilitoris]|uniref:Uncharacterized protein n=1 Tax=Yoonia sediminilitoris TaxID=1286148 RepID=A0A2T6KRR6_9RHOB|nr:hypothetical protein [Yoonia sediminilitoris]PUB19260.1 hypothetical protein C8N45_101855 [Yoonia sediminilitoris]RCW99428.1 hypothetical protein DFP92_101855 [Yoonia sediminilitoris]